MKILYHNFLDVYNEGYTVCVTTNGFVKKDNKCVMGAGVAKIIRDNVKGLDLKLGRKLIDTGENIPFWFPEERIISFPVKHNWWEKADLELIRKSCQHLVNLFDQLADTKQGIIFLPIPGIGNGQLKKEEVLPILESELSSIDNKVILLDKPKD